jgi:uncharacterized protein YjbI with pentapeptide repeats
VAEPNPTEERAEHKDETWSSKIRSAIQEGFKKNLTQVLWFVGILGLYLLLGRFLFGFLEGYVEPSAIQDRSKEATARKDLVQALGFLMVGVAGAVGIFFTWRGQRLAQQELTHTRQSHEQNQKATQAQLQNAQEELRLTRQGQITERFTRAIDQLGNESLEIRLGGIYALERIARESEEDHWPIMEVLTAYVRQHAPLRPEQRSEPEVAVEKKSGEDSGENNETIESLRDLPLRDPDIDLPLAPDIQATLTVLRRRTPSLGHGEPEPLDLHATNLLNANLPRANLKGANLRQATLKHADLSSAVLSDALLWGANLALARLRDANLTMANLTMANLSGADFSGADLSSADLWGADFRNSDLSKSNLSKSNLSKSNLRTARFFGTDLSNANLSQADLWGANLLEANLSGADLSEADLSGADLSGAEDLTQAQLEETYGDQNTKLPPHLKPPRHWGVKTDEQTEGD